MSLFSKLALSMLFPLTQLCAEITGTYDVHGGNHSSGSSYTGTLVIEKEDQAYKATWTLSDGSSTGYGIRKDNFIAIDFIGVNATEKPLIGVQLYEIKNEKLHRGPWTINGEGTRGFEIAKKKQR